jgi:hypothetical protein
VTLQVRLQMEAVVTLLTGQSGKVEAVAGAQGSTDDAAQVEQQTGLMVERATIAGTHQFARLSADLAGEETPALQSDYYAAVAGSHRRIPPPHRLYNPPFISNKSPTSSQHALFFTIFLHFKGSARSSHG